MAFCACFMQLAGLLLEWRMDSAPILDPLNEQQREAVTSQAQNLLVLAGAGSGKTRVLVHRIGWLLATGQASPFELLAVTFTNKAAREMRERVEILLAAGLAEGGNEVAGGLVRGMWIGTFHALARRLLMTHRSEAGFPDGFTVIDSDDQLRMIKRLARDMNIDDSRWPARRCQWAINSWKEEGLRPGNIEPGQDARSRDLLELYDTYQSACERGGMVDFAELLLRAHELWLNNPQLLAHYQNRFRNILVDEFQDCNSIQYAWVRVLAGNDGRVTVVGDDDQSIYGWRGAKVEYIQQFQGDFPDAHLLRLERNYRSTSNILNVANQLIAHNRERLGKTLWTDAGDGELVGLYDAFNEQDEARFIAERVATWFGQGERYADAAVLYRSNAQSRELEDALLRVNIPYRIYGGLRFYERLEIKNALAYLRLLINRHDDAALERVINVPTRGIGDRTVDTIRQLARQHQSSLWDACVRCVNGDVLAARASAAVLRFLQLVDALQGESAKLDLPEQAKFVIESSGLIEHHEKEGGEIAQNRLENLEELVNAAGGFAELAELHEADERNLLSEFLDQAALDAGDAQAGEDSDAVQLMTLHSAKGLEFPLVFLAGMEEGLFPHRMSMEDPNGLEEERRLCYVGITRARKKLYLTHAESRRLHGHTNLSMASRFISEIPRNLVENLRLRAQVRRPRWSANIPRAPRPVPRPEPGGLPLGQRVAHNKFGEGVVLQSEGNGENARVQVNFDTAGSKWLALSHAKLTLIGP